MGGKGEPPRGDRARLQERLHEIFEQAFSTATEEMAASEPGSGGWSPALDVLETEQEVVVLVDLPGVRREEIEVEVQGRWLELSGSRSMDSSEASFLRLEGRYGPFRRRVELPQEVDPQGVSASTGRGVLEIRLPKRGLPKRGRGGR